VVEEGAFEPVLDLMCCSMKRTTLSSAGSAGRIPRKELEFVGSSGEAEKLHCEMLDSTHRRVLFETNVEWCSDASTIGRRVLECDFRQPRSTVLELGADPYGVDAPADSPWVAQCPLDQLGEGVSEHGSVGNRVREVEAYYDWFRTFPPDDRIECGANCQLPCTLALCTEL
jgi:hypothetical protein